MISVYTDGAFRPTTGQGGYACVIVEDDFVIKILHEGIKNTTNNRAELFGVLETLRYFKTPMEFTIYSDSQYVVTSIITGRLSQWIEEQDTTKKNMDLWKQIYDLLQFHKVNFEWIKGHNGNDFNEIADCYASHSAEVLNPKIDIIDYQDDKN